MSYDLSNSRNLVRAGRAGDRNDERSPGEEDSQAVYRTRETAASWAWARSNESYDWMDSHSPFDTHDPFH